MLSRLDMIGKFIRISKLLPIKRYQSNFPVDNIPKAKTSNKEEKPQEHAVDKEDVDLKHDRCMLTKDAKIKAVDLDGKKIEPININPWYEEDQLDKEREEALKEALSNSAKATSNEKN